MRQYERSGVVVDQCGDCRGIFLDRGELERLVDAENAWHGNQQSAPPPPQHQPQPQPQQSYPQPGGYQQHGGYQQGYPQKKRKSFLDELFD
jgi:Zn-finger nucleic acid-binding protein